MTKIQMTKDFSLNGKPLKKETVLTIHTQFKENDIGMSAAKVLIERGVAKELVTEAKAEVTKDAESKNSRPVKK